MSKSKSKVRRIQPPKKKTGLRGKFNKGNLVKLILPKLVKMGVNLVHIGPRVILRSTFQILRTNIWTRILSTFLLVSIDLYSFFRKRISKKQLVINLILSTTLLVSGTAGWLFGTNSVLAVVAENTAIWILAGLAGAGIFSAVFDAFCRKQLGKYITNDLEDMVDVINEEFERMVIEHALDDKQANAIAGKIHLSEKTCLYCFCEADRKKYIRNMLAPYFQVNNSTMI